MNQDEYNFSLKLLIGNDELIINKLSEHLYNGELAFALGAGVSRFLGFPLWWELVRNLQVKQFGDSSVNEDTSADDLRNIIDEIQRDNEDPEDPDKFNNLVKGELYKNINYLDDKNIIQNQLLISLGAMIMGSRRGSINRLITYNFDDLLEWYLGLHGFDVRVIHDPRRLITNSDVVIFHPHGFLPLQSSENGPELIFSETSFINRVRKAKPNDSLWEDILDRLFIEKISIFVGVSGKDSTIKSRLLDIYENQLYRKRPVCYWFYIREREMETREINSIIKYGIVPIVVRDESDIPKYLLKICQLAISRIHG